MPVATFGPTTGWSGKTITYEADVFTLEEHESSRPPTSSPTTRRVSCSGYFPRAQLNAPFPDCRHFADETRCRAPGAH